MSSRTLFSRVILLSLTDTGPPSDAQQASRIPKIGFLSGIIEVGNPIAAFRAGLRELGYIERKTVLLEVRYAEGAVERLPELARELVGLKPDVIVATSDFFFSSRRRHT